MMTYPMLKMVKNYLGFDNATEHNMASDTNLFFLIYIFKNKIHYILLEQVNLALNGSVKYNGKTRHGIKSMMAYPMLKIVKNNLGHCPQRQQYVLHESLFNATLIFRFKVTRSIKLH